MKTIILGVTAVTAMLAGGSAIAAEQRDTSIGACVLVSGGGGTVTGNSQGDGNWFKIDSAITNFVVTKLIEKAYAVQSQIIDTHDSNERFRAVWSELSKDHCAKVVQITHELQASNGRLNTFAIKAEVLHFDLATGKRQATAVGDYKRSYKFPMTSEVMDTLSLSGLAGKVVEDLAAAGVLPK